MFRFILRRLAIIPPVLAVINFLGYTYAHVVLPIRAAKTPYVVSIPEPGPLLPGYWNYLKQAGRLDFGEAFTGQAGMSLATVIGEAILASLGLMAVALAIAVVLGLIIGLASVRTNPPSQGRWLTVISAIGMAMPSFYIGMLLLLGLFAFALNRPGQKLPLPLNGFGWDAHLVMPTLALMVRPAVQISQVTSGLVVDELGKMYIVAARSFGNSWRAVRRHHALRSILAAVILSVASSSRLLVGELILVEWFFRWPGLGFLFAQTLIPPSLSRGLNTGGFLNPTVVATILTVFAALFLATDLAASIVVRIVDPRLRITEAEEAGNA